jgi:hypothetical protein
MIVPAAVEVMAIQRIRSVMLVAVIGLIAALAGATLYDHYHHGSSAQRTASVARPTSSSVSPPEPYDSGAAHVRARAALQECLQQAESAAKTSWDGMCTALAQRNSEQRDNCRQQGRTAADCQSAYAETPVRDCLLPHQTASSVAQAQQSAKSDCYQQFQAQMR